jgi:hypothetical protein
MNTVRALGGLWFFMPSRYFSRIGPGVWRKAVAPDILNRLLVSMSLRRRAKVVQPLTVVLWSSSVEGIASGSHDESSRT